MIDLAIFVSSFGNSGLCWYASFGPFDDQTATPAEDRTERISKTFLKNIAYYMDFFCFVV